MRQRDDLDLSNFPRRRRLFAAEGGAAYLDERADRFYVITDGAYVTAARFVFTATTGSEKFAGVRAGCGRNARIPGI